MWTSVEVSVGPQIVRGRYRVDGDMLVLEWRGGRHVERYGLVKPELVAMQRLRREALDHPVAA
ncbi:hypothetical protein [Phenylobacterium sp.]|uniref:hypothetical protein n=1 Tax=Phenylobacterium sp. TaxID=1871053 RepID=UPI00286CE154|nr:hypothetical protein [Phenylobacterium sp.]